MSNKNRLLLSPFRLKIMINGASEDPGTTFLRIPAGSRVELKVDFKTVDKIKKLFLHTDLSGKWEMAPFESPGEDTGKYSFIIDSAKSGIFSFRIVANDSEGYLWDTFGYRQLLCDPSAMEGLRIYTLIPNVTGRISGWTEKLNEISRMGFNAVHLLPFTKMGSSESPYAASDLFSIDESYADDFSEFKKFVSAAKKLDMKICLDIVLNHVGSENVICRENAAWIIPDSSRRDGMKRAGCYHNDSWISWEDLVLVNYDHPDPAIRKEIYNYMLKYVLFWIHAAGGKEVIIRLDNLHSSNRLFIEWLLPEIRKKYPEIIILSEYFGSAIQLNEDVSELGLNLLTANSWEYPFAPTFEKYLADIHRDSAPAKYLLTPISHDTESVAELFGTPESSIPRYACCALMGTGQTGIVQGFEKGIAKKLNFIGRNQTEKAASSFDTGSDYSGFIAKVNQLVRDEECLRRKGNVEFINTGNDSLIVCLRRSDEDHSILIAVNFNISAAQMFSWEVKDETEMVIIQNAEVLKTESGDRIDINLGSCGVCVIRTGG